jgi:peroxiredoxin
MARSKTVLLYAGVAVVSLAAGMFTSQWLERGQTDASPAVTAATVGVPEQRIDFTLKDLQNQPVSLSQWDGKVILLNFWATWCPPCRKEMPDFMELREELHGQGFEVIGVAIDRADPVQDFIDEIGVEYPILLAELEGLQIMKAYGNQLTTLPYTVLIDRQGKVVEAFRTEVSKQLLKPKIESLL